MDMKNKLNFLNESGQGTIEYIVIVAVVIVISLVAVGILISLLSTGENINKTNSDFFWLSQPISVTDSMADSNGVMRLAIMNNSEGPVRVNLAVVDNNSHNLNSIMLTRYARSTVNLQGVNPCTTSAKNYILKIIFTTDQGLEKSTEEKEIIVSCVNTIDLGTSATAYFTLSNDANNGHFPVWNTITNDWNASVDITLKDSTICFGETDPCDYNITSSEGNLIFNG